MPTFFDQPILNSPYYYPGRHWELNEVGQPTQNIIEKRRKAEFITPVPPARGQPGQGALQLNTSGGEANETYELYSSINAVRQAVDIWRNLSPANWQVTPETARLLEFWRNQSGPIRPFFCQVEAVETLIWLTEVAPKSSTGKTMLERLAKVNADANPDLLRIALKMATGAGKTTVMAMIIAWQTINACRRPTSNLYTKAFLIVTPGITIRDRLRVLQPNDPESYYRNRGLVPQDMLGDLEKARIVITNYHAFKRRERLEISAGGKKLLQGRTGERIQTLESEGQMIQRVMAELMGSRNLLVINDEAHHCYREKPPSEEQPAKLSADQKDDAKKNTEAARLWISGIEAVNRQLKVAKVVDLSATPFFLAGSGYIEGSLFPWTVSDFSLMDAIECGIVKLPRVPVEDNLPLSQSQAPMYRELWQHIKKEMPRTAQQAKALSPLALPAPLQTALDVLYGHYAKVYAAWEAAKLGVHPCFIVVCNNMATSRLVYQLISGFEGPDGQAHHGRLELFDNYDQFNQPRALPRTLLIDSGQLESGDALDESFREVAKPLIERFKKDLVERKRDARAGENLTEAELLREMMNTVGRPGQLGESIRCVVSVSMLTEGWDANTVTHVLGVRAFGTQLLCEQVVGRALRRQSYTLNDEARFDVEYADVFGIPFTFTAQPQVVTPRAPKPSLHVHAISPEREALEITFPCVAGYRVAPAEEHFTAEFSAESRLILRPQDIGPSEVKAAGIIGAPVDMSLEYLRDLRTSTLVMELTQHLLEAHWRDGNGEPVYGLFPKLSRIVRQWLDGGYLQCEHGTVPAMLKYKTLASLACEKIQNAITRSESKHRPIH
ncbi:MAG: DEAD/DEAH box helicase family protein, partial [Gammaproteobacteria bacterium]|nr:DEAD/DEAH box helicase family protein [Gammaproteobacteria bacterium]